MKILAKRAGLSFAEFLGKLAQGLKWCYACRAFHPVAYFGKDASRYDGLTALCQSARNEKQRARYIKVDPATIKYGPAPHAPRDNDKLQARQRINVLVRTGKLAHPNALPCTDCGHIWKKGERRHEYDHVFGYDAASHYRVEPVCTKCHAKRHVRSGTWGKKR